MDSFLPNHGGSTKPGQLQSDLLADSFGAVEHYRPKSGVRGVLGHPGYYWLAYEATNYLPTCTRCNTGKATYFPLAPGSPRAKAPGEESTEQPLLLNPLFLGSEVADHIEFNYEDDPGKIGGWAKGLSPRGEASIKRLDLNRPDLVAKRRQEQNLALSLYFSQRHSGLTPPPILQQLTSGSRAFSAAALAAFRQLALGRGIASPPAEGTFPLLAG